MSENEDLPLCSVKGCDRTAKTVGMCGSHYLALWREQRKKIEEETEALWVRFGDPSTYVCEGSSKCEGSPVLFFAPGGAQNDALPLCDEHRLQRIEEMRMDLRRLEERSAR